MVFLVAAPVAEAAVATTARVAIPKLVKYLAKNGGNKLIKKYGKSAFEAVLGTTAGVAAYNKTAEKVSGYVDSIGKDTESTSSIPRGSMPGVDRMTQMDAVMAVPNVNPNINKNNSEEKRGIGDNNPPSPIEDSTPPEKEPPEDPNPITELSDNIAIEATKKLLNKEKDSDAVNQTKELLGDNLNISTTLDDKLLNDLLVMRGGIEGFNERMSGELAPMPGATKSKMNITLQEKLFDKYELNKYPDGVNPADLSEEEIKKFKNTYNTQLQGIEYIVSVAYDAIGEKGVNKNINYGYPIFTLDNEGLPIAGAKIRRFLKPSVDTSIKFNKDNPGARVKNVEALYITEMGSIDSKATTKLLNRITEIAKENKIPYVVVEDLTSEAALKAFKKRGYEGTLKKEYKPFIGRKIQRPYSNRLIRQKNLVLKLPE